MLTIKRLEEKIEYKEKEKKRFQEEIEKKNDPSLTLTEIKLKKEDELQIRKKKIFASMKHLKLNTILSIVKL